MKTNTAISITILAFFVGLFSLLSVVNAQDFTQGFRSEESLARGTLVQLDGENQDQVVAASVELQEAVHGVVVRSNDAALTISPDDSNVYVATTGGFEVLVSNQNGAISVGDRLAMSSLGGVAMKAQSNQAYVVAEALAPMDFSNADDIVTQTMLNGSDGQPVAVSIARVFADVKVEPNPDAQNTLNAPDFILRVSETLAGKPVSPLRFYSSMAVFLVASAVAGSLLYSSVRSSITAIGRNPLSKKSVLSGLIQVVFVSLAIFISGIVAIYLILRL